jgi:hypothetical protein
MAYTPDPWPPRSGNLTIHTTPENTGAPRANRVPRVPVVPTAAQDSAEGAAGVEEDAEFVAHINRRGRQYFSVALLVVLLAVLFALTGCGGGSVEEDDAHDKRATPPDCATQQERCI